MNALTQTKALALSEHSARELNAIIERDAQAAAEARSHAASCILAGMKRLKPSAKVPSGRELLQRARFGRHGADARPTDRPEHQACTAGS